MTDENKCYICPIRCGKNRETVEGYCGGGKNAKVALVSIHNWEEPSISGTKGSGTVFFSGCNLRCVFCQNYNISHENFGLEISDKRLSEIFLEQQEKGVHNINLVSGVHYAKNIVSALKTAKEKGLKIPVVYNSNGYESVDTLRLFDGLIDIYIPDIKYFDDDLAMKYSSAPNYFNVAIEAVKEMYRQVGKNKFDENGIMQKGVIIRQLVLPSHKEDSKKVLDAIKNNFGNNVYVSIMSQYTPMYRANEFKEINRRLTTFEYEKVVDYFLEIGLENGYVQKRTSATSDYTPTFDLRGVERKEN